MTRQSLGLAALVACLCASVSARAAVVFSEDFSSAASTGTFSGTDDALTATNVFTVPGANGVYRVVSDPADPTFTNHYADFYDHTVGTSAGAMLFFDGSPSGNRIFYQSANVVAGSSYTFNFYVAAADPLNVPIVHLTIDGIQTGVNTYSSNGVWTLSSTTFIAQSTELATFAIVDVQTIDNGNDGALDDIALIEPDPVTPPANGVPEPEAAALLALGWFTAVAARRRRG